MPGDIVQLSAGDLVPADLRLISAKDLFVNQVTLTGEALPVEKHALSAEHPPQSALDLPNVCFVGTSVESGAATALRWLDDARTGIRALCPLDGFV